MNKTQLQQFFKDRILEILHKETLDTYRQRNHNAFTSLVELADIMERWQQMKVKTIDTVRVLGEECADLLKSDDCLVHDTFSKDLLISEIDCLLKSSEKHPNNKTTNRILFCLEQCIERNRHHYLNALIDKLRKIIFKEDDIPDEKMIPTLESVDKYISAICVQLVYEGYTKQALYTLLKSHSTTGFDDFFQQFETITKLKDREYLILWKVKIPGSNNIDLTTLGLRRTTDDINEINEFIKNKFKKIFSNSDVEHYYVDRTKAKDKYAALKHSRERMMSLIDNLHIGNNKSAVRLPENALVLEKRGRACWASSEPVNYFMDGISADNYSTSIILTERINKIYASERINNEVKERLRSSIRHLNYGDHDTELEQRFINYWIALEFIFSSPQTDDNTFTRLKTHLINVLACLYVKRNMDYITAKLTDNKLLDSSFDIWETKENLDTLADNPATPLIWRYKLKKMKSRLLVHQDKRKNYYNNHVRNLERHIVRIYNLRNVLIHEAGINQDIENITSNLRYYLVFILDQMIAFFFNHEGDCRKKTLSLEDFFNTFINMRKMIESDYDLKRIKSVPLDHNLW